MAATSASYTSNVLNQYTAVSSTTYTYDKRGNFVSNGLWTYGYDTENRLVSATGPGVTASYSYDPFGRRLKKSVNGITTLWASYGDQEIAEYTGPGNTVSLARRFVYGPGLDEPVVAVSASNVRTYQFQDALGSVILATNAAGQITEKYGYTGYGLTLSAGANTAAYRFTGRRYDPETGLYFYRARAYSPGLGRFLQTDPIGTDGGLHLYAYVGNDPLNATDPLGLQQIPPDAMAHILNAHGIDTPRTRPGNSVFSQEYSNPSALQQLSNDVFASPLAPAVVAPYGQGSVLRYQGQVLAQYDNGATAPYPIGTDANKIPTNQVVIDFDKATENVITMYPAPVTGSQGPQSSIATPGVGIVPVSALDPTGDSGAAGQNGYGPLSGATGSVASTSSRK
jgi:RHS repeat-associated protein